MKRLWILRGLKFIVFAALFVSLAGWAVMRLWNALLPELFQLPLISWGQALGLLVLSRLLFGFGGKGGFGHQGGEHGWKEKGLGVWKEKMAERWEKMTPEQQQKLRQRWESHCGPSRWGRNWSENPSPSSPEKSPL